MKRFPILGALLLIPAVALLAIVGCTSSKKDDVKPAADAAAKSKDGEKPKEGGEKKGKKEEGGCPR